MSRIRFAAFLMAVASMQLFALRAWCEAPLQITGYVFPQNSLLEPGQVNAYSITRVNYAFANIKNGQLVAGFSNDTANLAALTALRKQNAKLRILISVGGWLWSGDFSDMALTAASRRRFIQSAVEFVDAHDLDGLDIDWEYPGSPGAGHRFRPEDKQNFTALLKELRESFDRETKRTGRRLYLTIAAGASDEYLAHTEMQLVQQYVDTVNLMSYDYYEPGSGPVTGHHAPLFVNPADPEHVSADASVTAFENAGVPPEKLLLGIPFYGHVWGNVADREHGLYQAGKQAPGAFAPYRAIVSQMLGHGFTRYWDAVASAPYLYNPDKRTFVSYEDAQSIAAKCTYVLKRQLGGIMFWEYSNDPSGELLRSINSGLHTVADRPNAAH